MPEMPKRMYDHQLAPRIGQRVIETTGILVVETAPDDLPDPAYPGEMAYATTDGSLWVFDGDAWEEISGGGGGGTGPAGAPGEQWFLGTGAPSSGTGIVGDLYLNTTNGDYYEKTGTSVWTLRGNLTGPTGATGAAGADGSDADVTTHVAASDPHTGYQKESEKSAANGYASLSSSTKVPIAELPTGTSSSTVSLGNHTHTDKVDASSTISADAAAAGWLLALNLNYAPSSGAPESILVQSSAATGSYNRVFWLNENGVPRSAASQASEVPMKIHGYAGGQTALLMGLYNHWTGGGSTRRLMWGVDKDGNPVVGRTDTEGSIPGANVIVLTSAASVPTGLPSGTVIVRTP
jgi:hypothetical protein